MLAYKFVDEDTLAKKFVDVEFVIVPLVEKRFVEVELFSIALLAFKFVTVELATVVVAKVVVPVKLGFEFTAKAPVMVAFVIVAFEAVRFVNAAVSAVRRAENKLVVVASVIEA